MSYIEFQKQNEPNNPSTGKVRFYADLSTGEPYYKDEAGAAKSLIGPTGANGATGPQGPAGNDGNDGADGADGAIGPQGPAGPMNVEFFNSRTTTTTLPNSSSKQDIFTDVVNISGAGDCFLLVSLASRAHSASSSMQYDIEFNGSVIQPEYVEEHKDIGSTQENWRMAILDLGNLSAGNYNMTLRFSKGVTGGTAELKGYTTVVVRYS